MKFLLCVVSVVVPFGTAVAQPVKVTSKPDIFGTWHGTSICVDKATDFACKDEEVIYEFVKGKSPRKTALLDASKVIAGRPEPMYDLELLYNDLPTCGVRTIRDA